MKTKIEIEISSDTRKARVYGEEEPKKESECTIDAHKSYHRNVKELIEKYITEQLETDFEDYLDDYQVDGWEFNDYQIKIKTKVIKEKKEKLK